MALVLDSRYKTQILSNNIDESMLKQVLMDEFNNYQSLKRLSDNENDITIGNKRKSIGLIDQMLQKKKKSNLQKHNEVDEYLITLIEPSNINPCEW